ncbi:hypothetical protein CF104_10170 [Aeromonas jandaei]|nr:hypothetical protein CF104_10170 [Aeromonas jandaei]
MPDWGIPLISRDKPGDHQLGNLSKQDQKSDFTYKPAQARYSIQDNSTILVWLRKHGRLDWS